MATCQAKIRAWAKDDGVFECRKPYGHPEAEHVAPGLYEYQTICWLEGDRRQFRGEWNDCDESTCMLPAGHVGNHARP